MTTTSPFIALRKAKGAVLMNNRLYVNGVMVMERCCDRGGNKNTLGGVSITGYCLEGSDEYFPSIKKLIEETQQKTNA